MTEREQDKEQKRDLKVEKHDLGEQMAESKALAEAALKQAGVPVTFETLPGAGHGGTAFSTPAIAAQMRAFFDGALRVP